MKHYLVKDWMQKKGHNGRTQYGYVGSPSSHEKNKIRRLPIVGKDEKLVGIVTRSDVRQAEPSEATTLNVWEMNYLLAKLRLSDIMTPDPLRVYAVDSIKTAATVLNKNKIGALPVVDKEDHVIGILTESDIFRVLIEWFNDDMGIGNS